MRSAGRGSIVRAEDGITCVVHPVLESDVGGQVLAIEQVRRVDGIHHVAESRESLDPEFHIVGGNKLPFAQREHHVLDPDRAREGRARIVALGLYS